jgi:DNA-binding GntR family transcriptional regulator
LNADLKFELGTGKTADAVFATLRDDIVRGALRVGERLNEESLASRFGVSRTPIRECLQRLEASQLVRRIPYRGVVVCGIDPQQVTEFYMLRVAVDGIAARLAAQKRTPVDVANLRWINSTMRDAARVDAPDVHKVTEININFHEAVGKIADNPLLLNFIEQIHSWVRRADHNPFSIPGRPESGASEHDRIIDAIEAGNADLAESLTREHMQGSYDRRLQLLMQT